MDPFHKSTDQIHEYAHTVKHAAKSHGKDHDHHDIVHAGKSAAV